MTWKNYWTQILMINSNVFLSTMRWRNLKIRNSVHTRVVRLSSNPQIKTNLELPVALANKIFASNVRSHGTRARPASRQWIRYTLDGPLLSVHINALNAGFPLRKTMDVIIWHAQSATTTGAGAAVYQSVTGCILSLRIHSDANLHHLMPKPCFGSFWYS